METHCRYRSPRPRLDSPRKAVLLPSYSLFSKTRRDLLNAGEKHDLLQQYRPPWPPLHIRHLIHYSSSLTVVGIIQDTLLAQNGQINTSWPKKSPSGTWVPNFIEKFASELLIQNNPVRFTISTCGPEQIEIWDLYLGHLGHVGPRVLWFLSTCCYWPCLPIQKRFPI